MNRAATLTLTERDLRRAHRLYLISALRAPRTWVRLGLFWVVAIAAWTGVLIAAGLERDEVWEGLTIFAPLFAVAIFVVPVVLTLVLGPFAIRRRVRQEKQLSDAAEISWDDELYEVRTRITHNRIPWTDYVKWRENREFILLFLSDNNFQIVTKHSLSEAQIADIRERLSASR